MTIAGKQGLLHPGEQHCSFFCAFEFKERTEERLQEGWRKQVGVGLQDT